MIYEKVIKTLVDDVSCQNNKLRFACHIIKLQHERISSLKGWHRQYIVGMRSHIIKLQHERISNLKGWHRRYIVGMLWCTINGILFVIFLLVALLTKKVGSISCVFRQVETRSIIALI